MHVTLARSEFIRLASTSVAGLTLAICLDGVRANGGAALAEGTASDFTPNVWLTVHPDNTLTVTINKSEMGQGVATGLPTLVADELDFPLERVAVEFCTADPKYAYAGGRIGTGGSTSMRTSWLVLRSAGATARAMLVQAAAQAWNVDPTRLKTSAGSVIDPSSNRRATYGSLAAAASRLPIPADVELKKPEQWVLIGKASTQRTDVVAKTNGSAKFGLDVVVPGMRYAALARPAVVGGTVKSFDASRARSVKGVIDVVQVPQGVAVIADNTWAAFKGKEALVVEFDDGPNAGLNSPDLFAQAEHLAKTPSNARVALKRGDADAAAGTALEATYRGPYLAHAAMEPWNATADVRTDTCEVWVGTQQQTEVQKLAAQYSGLPLEKCLVHTTFLGGGFGGRSVPDPAGEAVAVSKAIRAPVKVVYTREDDIVQDHYRPMSVNAIRGVLDQSGKLIAMTHTVASQAVNYRSDLVRDPTGIDHAAVNGASNMPYDIPNVTAAWAPFNPGIRAGNWRAPDANFNIFVVESFIDELAHAAGKDPVQFRLAMLGNDARTANVLRTVAQRAGWNGVRSAAGFRGVAVGNWNGSYCAQIADISMNGGVPRVLKVSAVVDCGQVVNPDIVAAQVQSAINFALSAALMGKITISRGRAEQQNFNSYTVLHNADAPKIEVYAVSSQEAPTGIGELGVPAIAPAVANAVFAATGKRVRELPLNDALG